MLTNVLVVGIIGGTASDRASGGVTAMVQVQPPDESAAAANAVKLEAVVLEVHGNVKRAPVGISPLDRAGWTRVKKDDLLASGTQIKTGPVRSDVVLKFGDDTVIQVRKMTLASIDDFYRDESGQTVRLDLGYGAVRGGSVESELRSDLRVDSTVATLAKRGTEGLSIEVEPSTGYFRAGLSRSGLLSLLSHLSRHSREIRAGEYADVDNMDMLPVDQKLLDLTVRFYADESQSLGERLFVSRNSTGSAVLSPGSGTEAAGFSGRDDPRFVGSVVDQNSPRPPMEPIASPDFVDRPEGDFGVPDTFFGLTNFLSLRRFDRSMRAESRRRPDWQQPLHRPSTNRMIKGRAPRR